MRAFIALDLSREAVEEIGKIQDKIKKENEKENLFIGKLTEPENLHLTLKFFGEVDEKVIEEAGKRLREIKFKEFEAEISEIGVFSEKFIKIIWVKLDGKEVFDLQKEIDEKLKELFDKEQRFMSHVTIARVKNVREKKKLIEFLNKIPLKKVRFRVRSFVLRKSELFPEGPVYSDLEEYEF